MTYAVDDFDIGVSWCGNGWFIVMTHDMILRSDGNQSEYKENNSFLFKKMSSVDIKVLIICCNINNNTLVLNSSDLFGIVCILTWLYGYYLRLCLNQIWCVI